MILKIWEKFCNEDIYETKEEEITFRRKAGILDAWMEKNFDLAKFYSNVILIYTYTTYVNCIYEGL